MKRRVTCLLLAILALASITLTGAAAQTSVVSLEVPEEPDAGMYLDEEEVQSLVYLIDNGVTYITVASFAALMDPEAMVEEENGTVTVTAVRVTEIVDVEADETDEPLADVTEETLTLCAVAGENYITANGRCLYVERGNYLLDGRVAVPVRVLAQVYNLAVDFDNELCAVVLAHQEGEPAYLTDGDSFYDATNLYWLSHIIYAESGNQSLEGKLAVGNVVMNRVNSPLFPNDIYSVLFQKNQFSPAASGSIYRTPSESCVVAAKLVLEGVVVLENALFFNATSLKNTWASRNRPYITTIGGHVFYG